MTKVTETTSRHDIELNFDALTAYVVASLEKQIEFNRKGGDYESVDEHASLKKIYEGVPLAELPNVKSIVESFMPPVWYDGSDPMHRMFGNLAAAEWKKFKAEHMTYCDANDHSKMYELDAPILDDK